MPRQVITCNECQHRFIAAARSEIRCLGCRSNHANKSPLQAGISGPAQERTSPSVSSAFCFVDSVKNSSISPRRRQKRGLPEDDDGGEFAILDQSSRESPNDDGSEAVDDVNCTQLDEIEEEDDDQPILHLVRRKNARTSPPQVELVMSPENDDNNQVTLLEATKDTKMETCLICGSSLVHILTYNGRLQHVKRCSKKNGVVAKDVRMDVEIEIIARPTSSNPTKPSNVWHGDAQNDLNSPNANKSLNHVLMAGARQLAKMAKLQSTANATSRSLAGQKSKRQWQSNQSRSYPPGTCPFYKKIPGTDFVCDGFQYAHPSLTHNYFLTHFHSDHYGGITKGWNHGVIYCSLPTANLVHTQLGVDRQYLHPLPLLTPVMVACHSRGKPVTVTLLDANHCPGAVMFLFQVGQRTIFHVGDFRWNRAMMEQQRPLATFFNGQQRLDELFLDTTYCNSKYDLPTQDLAIEETVTVAVREWQNARRHQKRLLMLFGAYTIGKERIYLAVAERLGMKVYVDSRRYRVLSALEWPPERMKLLTTRPADTCLWVVPLGHINMKKLPMYLSIKIGTCQHDFDMVVGFRPTGWSHSSKGGGLVKSNTSGNLTVHSVPYSEHSSFPELVDCLRCLKPKKIVPTVSVSKSQEQVDLLLNNLKITQSKLNSVF